MLSNGLMHGDDCNQPHVSSPLLEVRDVVGSKETATRSEVMVPWLNRLSVTVGIVLVVAGVRVSRKMSRSIWHAEHDGVHTEREIRRSNSIPAGTL